MIHVPLEALPVSVDTISTLRRSSAGVEGCIVNARDDKSLRVTAWGPACNDKTLDEVLSTHPGAHAAWVKADQLRPVGRTSLALSMIDADPRLSPAAAAASAGVNPSAVYRALTRREHRGTCTHCQQLLPVAA